MLLNVAHLAQTRLEQEIKTTHFKLFFQFFCPLQHVSLLIKILINKDMFADLFLDEDVAFKHQTSTF